jgi:adenylate cyclase
MSSVRRLTAILAADVAGYSRLMGEDEEGTHERLKEHRHALVDPKIAEHHGRIVKTTGDGLLVEYPSVVDAVRCAIEVQRGMAERNAAIPPEKRIEFRVGINLGDVIAEGEDIFGDGGSGRLGDTAFRDLNASQSAQSTGVPSGRDRHGSFRDASVL